MGIFWTSSGPWGQQGRQSCLSLPEQVTLFAYSDLLLFTKEDEPGRCDVLRNPLYLQSVKLQEGKSDLDTPRTARELLESWLPSSVGCVVPLGW